MRPLYKYIVLQLALFLTIPFLRIIEFVFLNSYIQLPKTVLSDEFMGMLCDLEFFVIYSGLSFVIYFLLSLFSKKFAIVFQKVFNSIILILIGSLVIFFSMRGAALDQEIVQQSLKESLLVVKNSNFFSPIYILIIALPVLIFLFNNWLIKKKIKFSNSIVLSSFLIFSIVAIFGYFNKEKNPKKYKIDYQLKVNKLSFLINKIIDYKYYNKKELLTKDEIIHFQNIFGNKFISTDYPLLHKNENNDVLGPFFNKSDEKPNLVYIIVESLSSSMSGFGSKYSGMITPFFDSLSTQSLYWSNCLSSSAISFEILPTLVASTPYGEVGFSTIPNLPHHQSIVKILNKEDYYSAFISGSPIYYANQGGLMRAQKTRFIVNKFDKKYKTIGEGKGWSWGYADRELFRQGIDFVDSLFTTPYISYYITITTHPPYIYNNSKLYQKKFNERLEAANLTEKEYGFFKKRTKMFASFKSFDDELKWFLESYKKRLDYKNTIFIITGDHQGYYEPKNPANHFRVPLVIYSPLLKKPVHFKSVALHAQITPSILNYLSENYSVNVPKYVSWMADDLDTCRDFRNINTYPFIYGNKEIRDIIHNNYYLNGSDLYELKGPDLDLVVANNDSVKVLLKQLLQEFRKINHYMCFEDRIIPDTLQDNLFKFDSLVFCNKDTVARITDDKFPQGTRYYLYDDSCVNCLLQYHISFKLKVPEVKHYDDLPRLIISVRNKDEKLFVDSKELTFLLDKKLKPNTLMNMEVTDIIDISKLPIKEGGHIRFFLYNPRKLEIYSSNFEVEIRK